MVGDPVIRVTPPLDRSSLISDARARDPPLSVRLDNIHRFLGAQSLRLVGIQSTRHPDLFPTYVLAFRVHVSRTAASCQTRFIRARNRDRFSSES